MSTSTQSSNLLYGNEFLDLAKVSLFYPFYLHDIFRSIIGSTIDNGLGFHRSYSGKGLKLLLAGSIDVNLLSRCKLLIGAARFSIPMEPLSKGVAGAAEGANG